MKAITKFLASLCLFLYCFPVCAQENKKEKNGPAKGVFYIAFGTHRSFYSRSAITFRSAADPSFDFTLYKVRGKDDGGLNFITGAPQYNYALGYYSRKKNWGLEFNFDHIKYFIRQRQRVPMQGSINHYYYEKDTLITLGFVHLEHSDGGNYALLKGVYWVPLSARTEKDVLHLVMKAGAGPVIPKTNSTIMGKHRDDRYNISGYVIALEGGLRYSVSKLLFAEATAKGAYANYSRFLIADGTGSQRWLSLHLGIMLGLQWAR